MEQTPFIHQHTRPSSDIATFFLDGMLGGVLSLSITAKVQGQETIATLREPLQNGIQYVSEFGVYAGALVVGAVVGMAYAAYQCANRHA